jgi:hypothetical protein
VDVCLCMCYVCVCKCSYVIVCIIDVKCCSLLCFTNVAANAPLGARIDGWTCICENTNDLINSSTITTTSITNAAGAKPIIFSIYLFIDV